MLYRENEESIAADPLQNVYITNFFCALKR